MNWNWLDYEITGGATVGMVIIVMLIAAVFALAAWSRATRRPPKSKVEKQ
jgi:hypothetical protein